MAMTVQIINKSGKRINRPSLTLWVSRVRDELREREIQVKLLNKNLVLVFISEKEMRKLNKTFRKKDSVTDILSFSGAGEDDLGELALCLSFIEKKSPEDFSKTHWLYYLILHGILHLLGFDHKVDGPKAQKMYQLQDSVFSKLTGK